MTLLTDFADLREIHGPGEGRSWPEDEKNLLYVAITRAKNNLMMNNLVRDEIIGNDGLHRLITFRRGASPGLGDKLWAGGPLVVRRIVTGSSVRTSTALSSCAG